MKLKQWIEERGITHEHAAEYLDVSTSALRSWLYGQKEPRLRVAVHIERMTQGKIRCRDLLVNK